MYQSMLHSMRHSQRINGDDMASIGERLKQLRVSKGYKTSRACARAFGWNENTFRSHENGNRQPPRKWLLTYAQAFSVSVSWILRGVEDKARSRQPDGHIVPVLAWEDLPEKRGDMQTVLRQSEKGQLVFPERIGSDNTLAVPVPDLAMAGDDKQALWPGDRAVCDSKFRLTPGKVYLVYDPEEREHMFRRAQSVTREIWRFVPLNGDFRSIELEAKSPHIIAQVVTSVRQF